jgi:hypothetical protein
VVYRPSERRRTRKLLRIGVVIGSCVRGEYRWSTSPRGDDLLAVRVGSQVGSRFGCYLATSSHYKDGVSLWSPRRRRHRQVAETKGPRRRDRRERCIGKSVSCVNMANCRGAPSLLNTRVHERAPLNGPLGPYNHKRHGLFIRVSSRFLSRFGQGLM